MLCEKRLNKTGPSHESTGRAFIEDSSFLSTHAHLILAYMLHSISRNFSILHHSILKSRDVGVFFFEFAGDANKNGQ